MRRRLAVLVIATSLLTACATVGSKPRAVAVCPPVVEYSREFQARAAGELDLLPDGTSWCSESICRSARLKLTLRPMSAPNFDSLANIRTGLG